MFISGYDTVYVCKDCGNECKVEFEKQESEILKKEITVSVGYRHSIDGHTFQNGIPSACKNNGDLLGGGDVKKESRPIIEKSSPGYY